ncbi:MAG: hypothetical protein Q9M40_09155 [Sulfurimonas sp.]|nr:hypothetical protein [Sulfurimonas sp.]
MVNFEKLPNDLTERGEFSKLFKEFNDALEASKIQSFQWDTLEYKFDKRVIKLDFDENTYLSLVQRYKELSSAGGELVRVAKFLLILMVT